MSSRRRFLRRCVAATVGLAWAVRSRAEDKPEITKPDPLLTSAAEESIASGLTYLRDRQHKDGSFGTYRHKGNVGITSLCGLALLSANRRPSTGVDSTLEFILGQEDPRTHGFLNNPKAAAYAPMYSHGFAVSFLAAAHDIVSDKKRAEQLHEVLGRAVALTLASQNAEHGWRYTPASQDSDLSITAGQLHALRAARDAGIGVPKAALDNAAAFIKRCQDKDGGFRYMAGGGTPNWTRTAAGLLALFSAGVTRGPEVERGLTFLLKNRPDPKAAKPDMHYFYGHYYAALATWWAGGEARKAWYRVARDELIARQGADGSWSDLICPHYATAMALIALQVPNGFLSGAVRVEAQVKRKGYPLKTLLLCLAVGVLSDASQVTAADAPPPSKPNVVVLLADDLGFSDLGCYGGEIKTPNLDKLAADGVRYTQCYNTARCWPSRAALLTGYYAQQVNRDPPGLRPRWAALLPELLKSAGYHSYHSGKWHVDGPVLKGGFERSYLVVDQDRYFAPRDHQLDDKPLAQPKPEDGYYATTAITQHALDWLTEHDTKHRGAPFFLYLAFTCPHFPLQALPEDIARYRGRFKDGWDALRLRRLDRMRRLGLVNCELSARTPGVPAWDSLSVEQQDTWEWRMAIHAALVDRMDQEIGRVFDQLRKAGQWDKTLILFCSDNGASAERLVRGDGHDPAVHPGSAKTFLCLEPPWANLANAPLRKSKIFTHEGGISTPLIAHWPAGISARGELRHTPAHFVDFVPTLLELAGSAAPAAWNGETRPPAPGRSLVASFAADVTIPRDFLFFKHEGNRGLRVGDWKIVASGPEAAWELYDLARDRSECHDLAARNPDKVKELAALWTRHDEEFRKQGATALPQPRAPKPSKNP